MKTATVRILVADDYEPWRHFVRSTLQKRPEFRVVGEVSDGLEAVQQAQELQPDLIVLDIGLPTLNGIQAAQRIRKHVPQAKILFLSENRSWDIVEEALRTGAGGYVVKWESASDLLPAVEAVLRGTPFFSASLVSHNLPRARPASTANPIQPNKAAALTSPRRHDVEFYPDDGAFIDGFAQFIEANLKIGNAVVVIATEARRAGILRQLSADGLDPAAAMEEGSLTSLDASETLSTLTINHAPDPALCVQAVGDLITSAAKGAKGKQSWVAICGECAPTLLTEGYPEAAIQLEHLWDETTRNHNAETLCGYLSSAFQRPGGNSIFERICAEHRAFHVRSTAR